MIFFQDMISCTVLENAALWWL